MKRAELVYREILYRAIEKNEKRFTQSELYKSLGISLSIVNSAVQRLSGLGAVKILQRSFTIVDIKKVLYFWASIRNLKKDIILSRRIDMSVRDIERNTPPKAVYTAYSAYKFKFKDVPADYSEVYVYAGENEIEIIKKRFFNNENKKNLRPNIFILKKDNLIERYEDIPIAQIFVDLWNLGEWYAKEFINALDKKIGDML